MGVHKSLGLWKSSFQSSLPQIPLPPRRAMLNGFESAQPRRVTDLLVSVTLFGAPALNLRKRNSSKYLSQTCSTRQHERILRLGVLLGETQRAQDLVFELIVRMGRCFGLGLADARSVLRIAKAS